MEAVKTSQNYVQKLEQGLVVEVANLKYRIFWANNYKQWLPKTERYE